MRLWKQPVAAVVAVALTVVGGSYAGDASAELAVPRCAPPQPPFKPVTPTTIDTIEQVYYCIFDHYYGGAKLDDRMMLTAAFIGFTQELQRRKLDQGDATMPALTGDRDSDWAAFSRAYQRVVSKLPDRPEVRQAVAAATVNAMVGSLRDNHARWVWAPPPPADAKPDELYGLGIDGLSAQQGRMAPKADPTATAPLFVTEVLPGSPADLRGVRPGDVIVSVNGAPPFVDGVFSTGVLNLLNKRYPHKEPVKLKLYRPATDRTLSVTLRPAWFKLPPLAVTAKLLPGDVAYVKLPGFNPGAADEVVKAVERLAGGKQLRGLILDLRGNGGGAPDEVARLVGAFVHGKDTGYLCDAAGSCEAMRTDDTVPLLRLPLVVLTDRNCGSACDHFSTAVKDLGIARLVGARTAGDVSGPADTYDLSSDNSVLVLPARHYLGPNREIVDGIGVAPDIYQPITAKDLSTGRDPNVETALDLLK